MIRPASCQGVSRSWNAIRDGQTANASILVATVLERRSHRAQKMGETTADARAIPTQVFTAPKGLGNVPLTKS